MLHRILKGFMVVVTVTFLSLGASASWAALTPTEVAKLIASDGAGGDFFGYSVALSGDTAVIGAWLGDSNVANSGAAYVFTRSGAIWSQQAKLIASDAMVGDAFGYSVAISGDTIVIGARSGDGNVSDSGSAYVFTRSGSTWSQQTKLIASDGSFGDFFGWSIAIHDETVVVGSWRDDDNGTDSGSVYVFTRSGSTWSQQAKLSDSTGAGNDRFGWSVSVSDDTVLVGSYYDDDNGTNSGTTYVFIRSGTTWSQQAKLSASDATSFHFFGVSLALSGDTALIGASGDDDNGIDAGAAYVFTRNGTTWSQQAKLTGNDAAPDDESGWSVALSGDIALLGAIRDDDNGTDSGSVYIFIRNGTTWTQEAKLIQSDGAVHDFFSFSMGLSGDTVLIGASLDDDNGADSGSAYIFTGISINEPPVAEAGLNQAIHVGQNVVLDGSGSTDDNTASEDLLYNWIFSAKPVGSTAVLSNAGTVTPSFMTDLPGDYIISLVVTDEGTLSSDPDTVTVSSLNTPPTANAGTDQGSYISNTVMLDGSASIDPDFDLITYAWTFSSRPSGSSAILSGTDSAIPTFTPDLTGSYVAQLIVNDGYIDSTPDEVHIAVITPEQYVEVKSMEVLNIVSVLPPASVTTSGNQKALGNFLLQVIKSLQKSDINKAKSKLVSAIERTDGCALRGTPDTSGGGKSFSKDYVTNCVDQNEIYPLLVDALNALTP